MVENEATIKQLRQSLISGNIDDVIGILTESDGVDIDFRDVTHDLQTILMFLCYVEIDTSSKLNVMAAILKKSPDVNIQDRLGRTALMHSCIANAPVVTERLLEVDDVDVSVFDVDGNTVMTYAILNCDAYTVEDLLDHVGGPELLNKPNLIGQTPLAIAGKRNDPAVMRLLKPHQQAATKIVEEFRKRRKPRNRDVTKQLPPAYSPSPERRVGNISNGNGCGGAGIGRGQNSAFSQYSSDSDDHGSNDITTADTCDSDPSTCAERPAYPRMMTSLSLTSPKMGRHHHKQDCLLTETLLHNQSKMFPNIAGMRVSSADAADIAVNYDNLRRGRRPSVSLPDLRNVTGTLVSSGNSSPAISATNSEGCSPTPDDPDSDDVFSQSYPTSQLLRTNGPKVTYQRQQSAGQLSLPDINRGIVTLVSPKSKNIGLSPLVRQRKISNSDDHLLQKSNKIRS
ncbi:ankyrin repeat domain-containing protein 34B-like [Dreissena polymorpha]|uniref:Uncharacterized protein n=1 Tax=Dreissena polymorpha TaxID=45954 RepID=A0A9D4I3G3_DREPO|nr:ankyrin repeat domain-containing protein 34B-like [Dreissena polymorpha]XP_052234286.1 ankyrin repeat domain-containing protein 34B-like [Dreissena polymorpha]KAH3746755.1 hypothetical protein DPMN_181171 [Dreissena polymorpha]